MKKRKFKFSSLFIFIGFLFVLVGTILFFVNGGSTNGTNKVSYKDDFYEYVNFDKLNSVRIPTDSNAWSTFYDAQVRINTKKQMVVDKLLKDPNFSDPNIDIVTSLYEDYEARNSNGLKELKPYFDMIDSATTIDEFNEALVKIRYDLEVTTFVNFSVENDIKDSTSKVLVMAPAKLEDIYEVFTLDKFSQYKKAYVDYRKSILKEYGYNDEKIEEVSNKIDEFIANVQKKSKNLTLETDTTKLYNYYTIDDIKENIHNVPIIKMFEAFNIDNLDTYVFYDFDHYKELDKYYTIEYLDLLKEMEKIAILENVAAAFTTNEFFNIYTNLFNSLQGTKLSSIEIRDYLLRKIKEEMIEEELNVEYEKLYFNDSAKEEIRELINEIKDYYRTLINESSWMEESTKEEAIKKINDMKVYIGYKGKEESEEIDYVSKSEGGTLLSNIILETRIESQNFYKSLESTNNSYMYDNLSVNAFYNPFDNSINFPAAFYELANGEKDYYKKLAIFGTVIGHEISHAFDDNGSKFDSNGALRNWWTKEDNEKYSLLKEKIIKYYNNYEVEGIKVDGERTIGENIADLAGMKAIIYIAEEHNATAENYKTFFESYAMFWATKITKDNLEKQMVVDTHSPNKVRVNAVLSSMDKFYEVYDIKEGDKMFIPKEERVGLW